MRQKLSSRQKITTRLYGFQAQLSQTPFDIALITISDVSKSTRHHPCKGGFWIGFKQGLENFGVPLLLRRHMKGEKGPRVLHPGGTTDFDFKIDERVRGAHDLFGVTRGEQYYRKAVFG